MRQRNRPTSLRARLLAYLAERPRKSLSIAEASARWCVTVGSVRGAVYKMRKAGELGPGPELRLPG